MEIGRRDPGAGWQATTQPVEQVGLVGPPLTSPPGFASGSANAASFCSDDCLRRVVSAPECYA